jgi:hypothetical protein
MSGTGKVRASVVFYLGKLPRIPKSLFFPTDSASQTE